MARAEKARIDTKAVAAPRRNRLTAPFASLSVRNFRYMWLGQLFAATAMHADMLARSWLTYELTDSSLAVGAVNMVRAVPMLVFGLFGGVIADRFDPRKVLMIIQAWSLLLHASMAVIILTGLVQMWHVYSLAFLLGLGMAMNQPVRTSMIPTLVGREHMVNALSLNSIAINSTRLIGPAIIGVVIAETNVGYAYVVSSIAYVIVVWTTSRINLPIADAKKTVASMMGQLMEGFRFIGSHRMVLALVLLGLGPLAFGFAHQTLLPALVEDVLRGEADMMGYILASGAIGGVTGGLFMASHTKVHHKGMVMLFATTAYALAVLLFSTVNALWMVFPLMITIGVSQTIFRTANMTTLMEITPDRLRGRIISVTLLDHALAPVAGLIAGFAADRAGVPLGYVVLSGMTLSVVVLSLLIYPKIRKV